MEATSWPLSSHPISRQRTAAIVFVWWQGVQLRTIKVIKFDNLRTRIFIEILTSDSEPETSKASRNGVALIFPRFFGCTKFLGIFNAPKSLPNQPSLDQFCAMHDPDVVDVWQNESGSNYIFSGKPWPGKGMPTWQIQQNSHHWGSIFWERFWWNWR